MNKNDEWYTPYEIVKQELIYYKRDLKDKTIYCNCDDPIKSNFVKYFQNNFDRLHLRRLIATCYNNPQADLFTATAPKSGIIYDSAAIPKTQ